MVEGWQVRITVVRRLFNADLARRHTIAPGYQPCSWFCEGDEFLVSDDAQMPAGFCSFAWADMHRYVLTLGRGGNLRGVRPGTFVASCSDGFRPVLFLLERVEQDG